MISVIICAYNEEKLINSCLEALAVQKISKSDYEIIIIDDESTDYTSEICKKFLENHQGIKPTFKYFRIKHGGLSIARNVGVQKSKGEIICFIDGDALADPHWLSEYHKTFRDPNVHYSSGRINLLNQKSSFASLIQNTRFVQKFTPPYNNHFHGVNMAFRREVFQHLDGFFENFESRGDDTTFRNIVKKHYTYQPSPEAIVKHERPESFKEWYLIFLKELKFQYLVLKALSSKKLAINYTIPLLKSVIINTLFLAGLFWWPSLIIALIAFSISKRKHLFMKASNMKYWGFNFFYHLLDVFLRPYYFLKSYFIYRKEKIRLPNTSKIEILISKTNV